uniref:Uncharacterized protein n=1 Tax=Avena sativa TaxID=4498 RepID=A0ACD5XFQ8_AVESA
MTTHTCGINSLDSLAAAEEFFRKNHGKYVVFTITGCVPLASAPLLLRAVRGAMKRDKSGKLSVEGLPLLGDLKERAEELERRRGVCEAIADTAYDNFEDYPSVGDPDTHTIVYRHATDMQRLLSSVQNMDIGAFQQLDQDVDGNIRRYEHHRAMFEDTKAEANEKWIPSINDELYDDDEEE